jgi:hypothetical protein
MNCPGCQEAMDEQSFEGNYGRTVALDICHACGGLWFDGPESLQLAPGSILRLLTIVHDRRADHRHPIAEAARCPRCQARLVPTSDRQRTTRFSYARCPGSHGRFITFFQFLREKNFVRALDPAQLSELRKHVRMVNCSNCGAPVDLEKAPVCSYCRAPLAMLDPKQLEKTVDELRKADEARRTIDPMLPAKLMLDRLKVESVYARMDSRGGGLGALGEGLVEAGFDLVIDALRNVLRP